MNNYCDNVLLVKPLIIGSGANNKAKLPMAIGRNAWGMKISYAHYNKITT